MPRLSSLSLTVAVLGIALSLGGCDRQSEPSAQQRAGAEGSGEAAPAVRGVPDRSHAGSRMPDFTFADPAGNRLPLASLNGTPVLLNLWATWCAPCVIEMPKLDLLAGRMQGRLKVVTVSQDMQGAKSVAPFFAKRNFAHLEPWLDPESELAFHYGGATLPMTILYDAQGREVWRIAGDFDWTGAEARELVAEVTGG